MKKSLSTALLSLVFLVSMSSIAFAAPREGSPGNSPKKQDPVSQTTTSNPQGRSDSNPDGGGVDKPGCASDSRGCQDTNVDRDGNNGCGNDVGRSDDNNGNCGRKARPSTTTTQPSGRTTTTTVDSQPTTTIPPRRTTTTTVVSSGRTTTTTRYYPQTTTTPEPTVETTTSTVTTVSSVAAFAPETPSTSTVHESPSEAPGIVSKPFNDADLATTGMNDLTLVWLGVGLALIGIMIYWFSTRP